MAHELVGTTVILKRPVIVKEAHTRQGDEGKPNVFIPAEVEMRDTHATVVGVEPVYGKDGEPIQPKLQLAFLHPDRLHHIGGSGWRDSFDRLVSVRHQLDPEAIAEPLIPRWRELDEVDLWKSAAKKKPATPVAPTPVAPSPASSQQIPGDGLEVKSSEPTSVPDADPKQKDKKTK